MPESLESRHPGEHWVPRSYLRRFSPNGTHVYVYDAASGRVAFVPTRNIVPAGVLDRSIARELDKWEGELSDVTDTALRVAAGDGADQEVRRSMSVCVALQLTRMVGTGGRPILLSSTIPELAADLYHYVWQIGINGTDIPLITSDRPVIRGDDSALVYPLTPAVTLMMYDPAHPGEAWPAEGRGRHLSVAQVRRCNELQLLNCRAQAYSRTNSFVSRHGFQTTGIREAGR